jgi:hypothetical protein
MANLKHGSNRYAGNDFDFPEGESLSPEERELLSADPRMRGHRARLGRPGGLLVVEEGFRCRLCALTRRGLPRDAGAAPPPFSLGEFLFSPLRPWLARALGAAQECLQPARAVRRRSFATNPGP